VILCFAVLVETITVSLYLTVSCWSCDQLLQEGFRSKVESQAAVFMKTSKRLWTPKLFCLLQLLAFFWTPHF